MIEHWIFLREVRLPRRALVLLFVLFALGLVAQLPLRLAAGMAGSGFSAQAVTGTVWSGRIGELAAGKLPLGTLDAGVRPLPLLLGRVEVWLARPASAQAPFAAILRGSGGDLALRHVDGTVPVSGLGTLPVSSVGFDDFAVAMHSGACADAGGTLTLHVASPIRTMPGDIALSGKARCQDGALVVPMQGAGGVEHLLLKVQGTGKWSADLVLTGLPPEATAPLLELGFSARSQGLGLTAKGSL